MKFYNNYIENDNVVYDEIINFSPHADHIHHILPLEFGGNNNPKNLIGVIGYFHDLLHMNPFQHIEKYCYMTVDYLKYLVYWDSVRIFKEYEIHSNMDSEFQKESYKIAIKLEMKKFYDNLFELEKGD